MSTPKAVKEDLLHYIWKHKKFQLTQLVTSKNEVVAISNIGTHNHLSGPDFFNAKISIGKQWWAGNVEIHSKSSDWYAHRHEDDRSYDNVILHVVWEDDVAVFRKDGSEIPSLELANYISEGVLKAYQKLFDKRKKTFINCQNDIAKIDAFVVDNWLERLYFERLEQKSKFVFEQLEKSKNDWEQVLFVLLLKNFGLNINGDSFFSLAKAFDFSVIRKLQAEVFSLESVLLGMSHLLDDETVLDAYYVALKNEYQYLKTKLNLSNESVIRPQFFKLRPPNFPTIRISQLANLYVNKKGLFDAVMHAADLETMYQIFDVSASPYWSDHFTFGKVSKKSAKKLTKKFIDLLIINTILPLKYCYASRLGKEVNEQILQILSEIKKEGNSVVENFENYGVKINSAKDSQAVIQLYKEYCTKNRCLDCSVGSTLLKQID